MRGALLLIPLLTLSAQETLPELQRALIGSWTGILEYRDYSEPATSTKRVKLPTWLKIETAGADLRFRYVYDDGPTKTVTDTELIRFEPTTARYSVLGDAGKMKDNFSVAGLTDLRQGRGLLTLTGPGTENDAPVNVRTTMRIGRNMLKPHRRRIRVTSPRA